MAPLWSSSDAAEWLSLLESYSAALEGAGKDGLVELDRWFYEQLPQDLHDSKRQPAHLTQPELVKLVQWKLMREKNRPNLLKWAREAAPAAVEDASTKAFGVLSAQGGSEPPLDVVKRAMAEMTVIKGVGPATASAILEAFNPSIPYLSDAAMLAALKRRDYTVARMLDLTEALRGKAQQLRTSSGRDWTAAEVERCLHAAALAEAGSGGGGTGAAGGSVSGEAAGTKRKR